MRSLSYLTCSTLLAMLMLNPATAKEVRQLLSVVEIFQSQGCSSCPPANANVIALSKRPDVLALSFGVTYWDYLGWKDTFASVAFTRRQWDYAHTLGHSEVFTPQVIVNGTHDAVGQDRGELDQLIRDTPMSMHGPEIDLTDTTVMLGSSASTKAVVWLVRYDPEIVQVPVTRGENSGTTIPHKNVVHELVQIGTWDGRRQSYALPAMTNPKYRTAILVQEGAAGPIVAATHS